MILVRVCKFWGPCQCHQMPKKCHVLFEWPLTQASVTKCQKKCHVLFEWPLTQFRNNNGNVSRKFYAIPEYKPQAAYVDTSKQANNETQTQIFFFTNVGSSLKKGILQKVCFKPLMISKQN